MRPPGEEPYWAQSLSLAGYMRRGPCRKRQEMVFAETKHLNVLGDHHLVISHIEHRAPQSFLWVILVAFGQIQHRTFHAFGSVPQAITPWVFAETNQHFPHEFLQAGTG